MFNRLTIHIGHMKVNHKLSFTCGVACRSTFLAQDDCNAPIAQNQFYICHKIAGIHRRKIAS